MLLPVFWSAPVAEQDLEVPEHLQEFFGETVERSKLSPVNQQYLADVFRRNSSAFATGPMNIGFCDAIQHDIKTGDAKPIKQATRRPPFAARDEEVKQLDKMLETGIIKLSYSPWSSPLCMAKKQDFFSLLHRLQATQRGHEKRRVSRAACERRT